MLKKLLLSFPDTNNAIRKSPDNSNREARPFLQWVGGKREMIPQYMQYFPLKFNRYYEPFLGGGAIFFYLNPKKAFLNDNNVELIKTYEGVRDRPEETVNLLKLFKNKHSKELYLYIRNLDRIINIFKKLNSAEIAARMIYLNQTCFNGLYRVNKNGQFNVPIGSSLNRLICDARNIHKDSKVLLKAKITSDDFKKILATAKGGDFVYLDPPYFPISIYSDFNRYTKEKFYKEDQVRLKEEVDNLTKRGCKVMLSNSDSVFIKNLYKNYKTVSVYSSRNLNCKKDRRGKVTELLILNY